MPRVTSTSDLREINRQLEQLDTLKKRVAELNTIIGNVGVQLKQIDGIHAPATSNNMLFMWTGTTLTISWPAGSVRDKNGFNLPVAAGNITGLIANTNYWMSWNALHQVMTAQISANSAFENPGNSVICQLFTGTAGQTGVAGVAYLLATPIFQEAGTSCSDDGLFTNDLLYSGNPMYPTHRDRCGC